MNGLIGGVKVVSSQACQLPIQLAIEKVEIDPNFQKMIDDRLLLAFTGKTRLARNILQNVLRRWARRTPEVVSTVENLVAGAQKAREAFEKGDLAALGGCLHDYYSLKKNMAGEESGVEPEAVRRILENLKQENLICGASLCGAGGGGFLVMIASSDVKKAKIHSVVDQYFVDTSDHDVDSTKFSWHDCEISNEGLSTFVLPAQKETSVADFDASWHCLLENNGSNKS